ncbi:hypothetical protein [Azospirillum sp. Marseille-Q6669]
MAVAEGTVKALPERLQDIARPVVLTGTVVGTTPEGLARVRTQAGEVLVQTPTPLPADKPVTLQITPAQVLLEQAQAASTDPAAASPTQSLAAKVLVLTQGTPSTTTPSVPTSGGPAPAVPGQTGATSPQGSAPQGSATPVVILPSPASATPTVGPAGQLLPLLLPGTIVPALVIAAAPKPPAPPGAAPALPSQPTATPAAPPPLPLTDGGSGQAPAPTQAGQPNAAPPLRRRRPRLRAHRRSPASRCSTARWNSAAMRRIPAGICRSPPPPRNRPPRSQPANRS